MTKEKCVNGFPKSKILIQIKGSIYIYHIIGVSNYALRSVYDSRAVVSFQFFFVGKKWHDI